MPRESTRSSTDRRRVRRTAAPTPPDDHAPLPVLARLPWIGAPAAAPPPAPSPTRAAHERDSEDHPVPRSASRGAGGGSRRSRPAPPPARRSGGWTVRIVVAAAVVLAVSAGYLFLDHYGRQASPAAADPTDTADGAMAPGELSAPEISFGDPTAPPGEFAGGDGPFPADLAPGAPAAGPASPSDEAPRDARRQRRAQGRRPQERAPTPDFAPSGDAAAPSADIRGFPGPAEAPAYSPAPGLEFDSGRPFPDSAAPPGGDRLTEDPLRSGDSAAYPVTDPATFRYAPWAPAENEAPADGADRTAEDPARPDMARLRGIIEPSLR